MANADRPIPDASPPADALETAPPPGQPVALDQSFDGDGLYRLRAAVAAHAADLGADEDTQFHLLIIAGELAANAVRHGGGRGRLRLWLGPDSLHCQVSDGGPGIRDADTVGTAPAPAGAPGGRGMWIVRRLAARIRIDNTPHGATVTATVWTGPDRL